MKKFLAILLAAMMLLAVTAAYADYTINYPTSGINTEHTYEIYQIFAGDLSTNEDGDPVLSNVVWGKNAASDYTAGEAVPDEILDTLNGTTGSDQAKLDVIKDYVDLTGDAFKTLTSTEGSVTVPAGYYLIKDLDGSQDGEHDAYTTYIVNVLNNLTISPKAVYPTVDKEVKDEVGDAELGATDGWGESADHAINETFQFRLTAELPASDKYADYPTYKVTFVDTMSDGITFEQIDSVTVDGITVDVTDFTCTATANQKGGSWELEIADLKDIEGVNLTDGAKIVVVYSAHLNEDAQIDNDSVTSTDNENGVKLQYSNNPNAEGEGETPEDFVWVFTYVVNNTKYANTAAEDNELAGAGFTLYDANDVVIKLIDNGDGTYTVADQDATAGYVTEMVTKDDGLFNIMGLDAGTYTLKETTVPEGYNKLDDKEIIISASHMENSAKTEAEMTLNSVSTMNNDIVNKSGATLPETGGIGTTLFYLFGGLMAAGSALILVVRRRADADEE